MATGNVLFDLLVRIKSEGLADVEKTLDALEKKAQGADKGWEDFNKKVPKQLKGLSEQLEKANEHLGKINENTDRIGKDGTKNVGKLTDEFKKFQGAVDLSSKSMGDLDKSTATASKNATKNLADVNKELGDIQDKAKEFKKSKIEIKTELVGEEDVHAGLALLQAHADDLKKSKITMEVDLKGNEEVVKELTEIEGVRVKLDGSKATITFEAKNADEVLQKTEAVDEVLDKVDGRKARATVEVVGAEEADAKVVNLASDLEEINGKRAVAEAEVKNVETETAKAAALNEKLEEINRKKVTATIELNGQENVMTGLKMVEAEGEKISHAVITMKVTADNRDALAKLAEADGVRVELDGSTATITLDADAANFEANMSAARAAVAEFDSTEASATIKLEGGAEVIGEAEAIKAALSDVDNTKVTPKVDSSQVRQGKTDVDAFRTGIHELDQVIRAVNLSPLVTAIGALISALTSATAAVGALASALGSGLVGAAAAAAGAVGTLTAALGLVAGATVGLGKQFKEYEKSLNDTSGAAGSAADKSGQLEKAQSDLQRATEDVGRAEEDLQRANEDLARAQEDAAQKVQDAWDKYRDSLEKVDDANEKVRDSIEKVDDANEALRDSVDKVRDAQEKIRDAHEKVSDAAEKVSDSYEKLDDATKSLTEAQKDYNEALSDSPLEEQEGALDAAEAQLKLEDATNKVTEARQKANEVEKDGEKTATERADAENAIKQAELDRQRAELDVQKQSNDAAKQEQDNQDKVAKAAEGVEKAQEGVKDATEGISDAQEGYQDSVDGVADAQEGYRDSLEGVSDAEEGVKDATEGVSDAVTDRDKAVEDSHKAFEAISRAEQDAQRMVEDATRKVQDAQRGVEDANRRVADAQKAINDALKGTGGAAKAAKAGIDHLSDAVRRLFDRIIQFKKEWEAAFSAARDQMAELGILVLDLASQFLPAMGEAALKVAQGLTNAFLYFQENLLKSQTAMQGIRDLLNAVGPMAETAAKAAGDFGIAIFTAFSRTIPYGKELVDYLAEVARKTREWTDQQANIEKLDGFLARAVDTAKRLWQVVIDLTVGFAHMFDAINDSGMTEQVLSGLEALAQKFRDITTEGTHTREMIDQFLVRSQPVLSALWDLLTNIWNTWFRVADGILAVQDASGRPELANMLDALSDAVTTIGDWLIDTFTNLGPALSDLIPPAAEFFRLFSSANTEVLSAFVEVLAKLLQLIVDYAPWLPGAVGTLVAFKTVLTGLTLIKGFALWITTLGKLGPAAKVAGAEAATATPKLGGFAGALAGLGPALTVGLITTGILGVVDQFKWMVNDFMPTWISAMKEATDTTSIGAAIKEGILHPLDTLEPELREKVQTSVSNMPIGGDIASAGMGAGQKIMEYLGYGVEEGEPELEEKTSTSATDSIDSFNQEVEAKQSEIENTYSSTVPPAVAKGLDPLDETMRVAFQNAHAQVANVTAEFARVITHNYETVVNNINTAFSQLPEIISTGFENMQTEMDKGLEAMSTDAVTTTVDEMIAEFERFSSEAQSIFSEASSALQSTGDSLHDYLVNSIAVVLVDEMLAEWDRLNSESDTKWSELYDTITTYALDTYNYVMESVATPLVDDVIAEWQRLYDESDRIWTDIYTNVTTHGDDIYNYLIGASTFPELVDGIIREWDRLNTESDKSWSGLFSKVTQKAVDIFNELVGKSTFPDLVTAIGKNWVTMNTDGSKQWTDMYNGITKTAASIANEVLRLWESLKTKSNTIWTTIKTQASSAMTGLFQRLLGHSPIPDIANQTVGHFEDMRDGAVGATEDLRAKLIELWNALPEELKQKFMPIAQALKDTMGIDLFEDLSAITQEGMQQFQGAVDDGMAQVAQGVTTPVEDTKEAVVSLLEQMQADSKSVTEETINGLMWQWNQIPAGTKPSLEETKQQIIDLLGEDTYNELNVDAEEGLGLYRQEHADSAAQLPAAIQPGMDQTQQALMQPIAQATQQVPGQFAQMGQGINTALQTVGQGIGDAVGGIADTMNQGFSGMSDFAIQELGNIMASVMKLLQFMGISSGNGLPGSSGAGGQGRPGSGGGAQRGGVPSGARGSGGGALPLNPRRMASGGVIPQEAIGGVSDGANARVVYGEQKEPVQEAYIVEGRDDNLPYLETAASWFGMDLVEDEEDDVEEYARGGVRRRGGRKGRKGRGGRRHRGGRGGGRGRRHHRGGRKGRGHRKGRGGRGHRGGGGWNSLIGRRYNQVKHVPKPKKTTSGTTSGRTRSTRSSRTSGTGSTSGTSPTGSSGAGDTGDTGDTGSGTGDTGAGTTPSTQTFPSGCGGESGATGLWPVAEPTDPATQANTDFALQDSGLAVAPAGVSGVDHVNTPVNSTGGTGESCGVPSSGGSLPSQPFTTTPDEPLGSSPTTTSPWQSCGPSFAMAAGGTMPSGATSSGGQAEPLVSAETDSSTWSSFMGYGWPGDPGLDWPEIIPPEGWDASTAYGDPYAAPHGQTEGLARGGIIPGMQEGGVSPVGGLNSAQLQYGVDAANQVMGTPYAYGQADPSIGFDCSGIWQWVYQAVAEGGSVPGPRYMGTYSWAAGGNGDMSPGEVPGAMNVHVDLSGWEGDGTHMSGNIMGQGVESTFTAGVSSSDSVSGVDGVWSLGDPATMAGQLPAGPGADPSGNMSGEVADWWQCQTAPYQGYDPSQPVNPWDSALPGMTQSYLDEVGQGTLGTSGYGGQPTGQTPQDWIVAALNGMGMDASPESIDALTSLMNCESGGDPNITNSEGSGATGLMQMMPETFDANNVAGGSITDPVANLMASINYQMGRYGHLVSSCPYKDGGMALGPHFGVMGEAGKELMLPLDNKRVMSQVRNDLMGGGSMNADVVARLDMVASEIRNLPGPVGDAVGGGMDRRLQMRPSTQRAIQRGLNNRHKRAYYAGSRHR